MEDRYIHLCVQSVESFSHVRLFATPWTAACQASLSITNSQSFLKLMPIETVMPSNHLILYRPLLLPPSIFPSIRVFSSGSVLCLRWPKYWSFSFSISLSNEHSGLIFFRIDWLDLPAVEGTLKSLLQHHNLINTVLLLSEHRRPILSKFAAELLKEFCCSSLGRSRSAGCGLQSPSSGVKSHASLAGSSYRTSHQCSPHCKMHTNYLVARIPEWHVYAWFRRLMTRKVFLEFITEKNVGHWRRLSRLPKVCSQDQGSFRIKISDLRTLLIFPLCSLKNSSVILDLLILIFQMRVWGMNGESIFFLETNPNHLQMTLWICQTITKIVGMKRAFMKK